jgi:hypothetical protein
MTDDDERFLNALPKNARRYLARFCCALCEHQLSRPGCSSVYIKCDGAIRIDRATRCLQNYRPRKEKDDDQDAPGSA